VVTDNDGFTIKSRKASLSHTASTLESQRQDLKRIGKQAYVVLTDDAPTPLISDPLPKLLGEDQLENRIGSIGAELIQDPANIENLMLLRDEFEGTPI